MDKRQLGGYGFIIGNGALLANGLIAHLHANTPESRKAGVGRMGTAIAWGMSGAMLARYGDQPVPAQLSRLQEKLAAFMQQEGMPLDAAQLTRATAEHQRGWFSKLEDFMYAHPIEISNAYAAVTGTGMAISGLLRRRDGNTQAGNANLALSMLTVTGALASILIPEKTPEQIAAEGNQGTLIGKLQEKPLNLVRWIFMAGDALSALEGVGEYRAASKLPKGDHYRPWQFGMSALSAFAMACFLGGDWLTGSGSKKASGTAGEREEAQQQLIETAASMLAQQPPEIQKQLAQKAAEYLSHQSGLRLVDRKADALAQDILLATQLHVANHGLETLGAHTANIAQRHAAPIETQR